MASRSVAATELATRVVAELERRNINPYISLAKTAIWLCSGVFVWVIALAIVRAALLWDVEQVGNAVGAAQALTVIALAVLGYHGYKGSQILYLLRHLDSRIMNEVSPPGQNP